jgi:hypothetical protein
MCARLFQHPEPVPMVSAFDNLAVRNTYNGASRDSDRPGRRWDAETLPLVSACGDPANPNLIVHRENVLNRQFYLGQRVTNLLGEEPPGGYECNGMLRQQSS